jgi:pimeloyl-ACP methyl ester carboxylesterase
MSDKPDSYDYKLSSQADLALAFVDALQVQQFLLVGHSMGGAIAILLALKYPDRVKHLVVIEPNLRAHDAQLSREMVKYRESEFIQHYQEFQSVAIDTVKHWFVGFRQRDLDDYIIELLKTTPVSMYRSAQSLIRTTRDETFLTQFQQLTIPKKHFLIGEETLKFRRIPSDFAANNIQTMIVPGVGHMMMVDNPAIYLMKRWQWR